MTITVTPRDGIVVVERKLHGAVETETYEFEPAQAMRMAFGASKHLKFEAVDSKSGRRLHWRGKPDEGAELGKALYEAAKIAGSFARTGKAA